MTVLDCCTCYDIHTRLSQAVAICGAMWINLDHVKRQQLGVHDVVDMPLFLYVTCRVDSQSLRLLFIVVLLCSLMLAALPLRQHFSYYTMFSPSALPNGATF